MRKQLWILIIGALGFLIPAGNGAEEPWGEIKASPNPCKIAAGQLECTSYITWHTRGVKKAKVWVTSKNRRETKERDFGDMLSCEGQRCRASWIKADDTYVFQLWEFNKNVRGKMLASVEVTGQK